MAETIRGINVVIGADTTKLSKALSDVNKRAKDIQSELRQVERLLKFDPKNTTLLAQKQQLLAKQIENTSEKLNRLKSVQQQVNEQFRRGEISEGQYRAFQREIEKTQGQLNNLRSKLDETNASINKHTTTWGKMQERLSSVGNNLRDVGQRMQSVGQSMATSMGAAATAIGGALGFAVKKSMDFEAQIDRVGAVAGATPAEIKKLEKAALDLGASTSKSATEVAQGMEIMAAMGYNTNQILAAMPGIIAAAEASGEDMALVADTVSAALNSFGLEAAEAARVADVLAQAANDSAAGIQDMQYTFKYAAPVAKSLGISLEQLAAATEIMSNAGIRGEQAGTTLRAALIRLSDPPKEAANTLEALGVKITDANGKMLPFSNIIGQLAEKTKNMSNAQKLAALSTIFGTEAASGMLTVVEAGPQKLDALTKSLQNSAGASQEAAQKMKDNLKGSLEELQGAFETAQITIGNALAPAIEKVAGYIKNLIDWFNNLSPSAQKTIAVIAAVTAVLAGVGAAIGVVLAIIGGAVNGFGALALAFGKVSGAIAKAGGMMGILRTALAALTGPVGIAIAAITGLIAIFVTLYKTNEDFRNKVNQIWQQVKNIFQQALTAIGSAVRSGMSAVTSFFSSKLQQIRQFWQQNGAQIQKVMSVAMTAIVAIVRANMALIQAGITVAWSVTKSVTSSVWSTIKGIISGGLNIILGVIKTFTSIMTGNWRGAWEGAKQIAKGAIQAIGAMSTMMIDIGRNIISGLIRGLASAAKGLYQKAKEIANNVVSTIKKALDIHSPSRVMMEIGKYVVQGLVVGIESESGNLRKAAEKMSDALVPNFRKPIQISEWQRKEMGRIARLGAAERVKAVEEWLSKQYELENIQAKDEVAIWNYVLKTFKLNAEERKRVSLKLRDAKRKVDQEIFENEKKYIEERKKYNQLSLIEELKMWEQVASRWAEGSQKRAEAEEHVYQLKKQIYDELTNLNNEYANKVKEVNERLYQDELKAREEYEAKVKEINDRLAEEERKLTEEYQKAVEDRTKSLYSFAGLFDEIKRKDDVTGQGLLKNLSDQVSAFKDWQANIASLAAKGIDEGLLQELRDMGPKAVDEIAALNSLSDEELNQYVQLWREKNALAKAQAVSELEGMRLETQAKIQQLRATANAELEQVRIEYINKIAQLRAQAAAELEQHKNEWLAKVKEISEGTTNELNLMSASMADIGKNSMQGLIDGLNSMMGPLRKKAQEIADTVRATIQSALDIHSPSRVMMELGKWIPAGLAEGINRNINAVVSATNRMVRATIPNVAGYSGAVVPATATINVPKMAGAKIEQHFHFHSTAPTPSEVARKTRQVSRQLAMEWGL